MRWVSVCWYWRYVSLLLNLVLHYFAAPAPHRRHGKSVPSISPCYAATRFLFPLPECDSCDKMVVMYDVSVLWEPLDNSAWSSTLWTQTLVDQERKSSRNWIVLIFSQSITITLLSFVLMLNEARPYTKISSGTEISNKPEYSFSNSKTVA